MLKNQGGLADAIEHCKKAIQTNPQWDEPRQLQVRQHCQLRTDSRRVKRARGRAVAARPSRDYLLRLYMTELQFCVNTNSK